MKTFPLSLLTLTLLLSPALKAQAVEQTNGEVVAHSELEQKLQLAEQARNEQQVAHQAQVKRLRQDIQQLNLQLKETQAQLQPRLLNEQQTWFALGAGVSLVSLILGALLRGRRKTKQQWMN